MAVLSLCFSVGAVATAVLGIPKDNGQPIQLLNAFENPVKADGKGLGQASREAMETKHQKLKNTWGISTSVKLWMLDSNLNTFLERLTNGF